MSDTSDEELISHHSAYLLSQTKLQYQNLNTSYLKTLKNSKPLPDFEEYAVYDTLVKYQEKHVFCHYSISKTSILCIGQYSVSEDPILRIGQYSIFEEPILRIGQYAVKIDDPNITMEEYIRLEEEKARRRAIVFNDTLTSEVTLSCEPTVSPLNDNKIDLRISFEESDDEDYMVIYDKNSFSYKIISVNDLKTDSKNVNDKVNMPSFPSSEPTVSYFNDLDYFKDFKNEFLAILNNDALTSKLDFLTINPQYIDEFNLKDETSLSECDGQEQNILYFNDLFPFNVIYPNDLKSDEDNDDKKN
ncbi:hypothetical protein Tco_0213401 [Tanacetum coccineum]